MKSTSSSNNSLADEKLRTATLQDPLVAKAAAEKREVEMKIAAQWRC